MASPIKFLLDLDAKLGKLPSADKILGSVARKLEQLDPGLKKTLRGFNLLGAGVGTVLRVMGTGLGFAGKQIGAFAGQALAHFTALASFAGLSMLARSAVDLGKSLITTVANGERADAVMKSLVGPEMFTRLDEWASKLSKVTEFDDDDIKKFASGLLKVGMAADRLPATLAIASDLTAITDTKDPTATLLGIGEALEKMQVKGGLDLRILNAAGISKKDFFGPLAKRMGIGMDTAEKRVADGKVSIDKLLEQLKASIKAKTGKGLGFESLERGQGLSATLDRIARAPDDLFKSLKGTDAMKGLEQQLARVAAFLDPSTPAGKKITEGLTKMVDDIAKLLAKTDLEKVSKTIAELFNAIPPLINATTTALNGLIKAASWFGKGTKDKQDLSTALRGLSGDKGAQATIAEGTKGFNDWAAGKGTGVKVLGSKWIADKLGFNDGEKTADNLAKGFVAGTTKNFSTIDDAVNQSYVDAPMSTLEKGLEIHSPSRVFERYGALTAEGFAKGLAGKTHELDVPAPSAGIMLGPGAAGMAAGGRRASPNLTVPITVNYNGAGGPDAAREMADMLSQILPGQLQHAFDRLRVELGTA